MAAATARRGTLQAKPNVVLVHGAATDGSSWKLVIERLQAAGHNVTAVQLDLASLPGDIATTRAVLAGQNGPTVLVGHSYGGAVITGAGTDSPNVISLVYVAAFAPDQGESPVDAVASFPQAPGFSHFVPDYRQGFVRLDPVAYPQYFMQDVDPVEARALAVTQKPAGRALFTAKSGPPAWRKLPTWYLVAEDDRMINPDAERKMATRMTAITILLRGSSHAAMFRHADEIVASIKAASLISARA